MDAWGGSAGVNWAISKLKEIDLAEVGKEEESEKAQKHLTAIHQIGSKGKVLQEMHQQVEEQRFLKKDEATLKRKADDFNKDTKELGYGVTVGQLKSVFLKEDSERSILLTAQRSNLHLLGHLQESMLIYIWLKMEDPKILNILPTTIYYQKTS